MTRKEQITLDELAEKLLGTEDIHPGILVRMDHRLQALEGNPMIKVGRSLKGIVAFLGAIGLAAIGLNQIFANLPHALHALGL